MNPQTQQPDEALIHREIYNRAHDLIAVRNNTNEDTWVIFDMRQLLVPHMNKDIGFGKGVAHLARYLAEKYRREMVNKILLKRAKDLVAEENRKRADRGAALLTHYPGENSEETIESMINVNDVKLRAEEGTKVWLGLVQRSPDDLYIRQKNTAPDPTKTPDELAFSQLDEKVYDQNVTIEAPLNTAMDNMTSEIEAKKENFINNIAQQNETPTTGIENTQI